MRLLPEGSRRWPAKNSIEKNAQKNQAPSPLVWKKDAIFASFHKVKDMHHLTEAQRYTISGLLQQKMSVVFIADTIKAHRSTVYREIKRNKNQNGRAYNPEKAHAKYRKRMKDKKKFSRMTDEMKRIVRSKLLLEWSPEQIRGWCGLNGIDMVITERIYQYIWQDKYEGGACTCT